jgi:hypothetical protein
MEMTQTKERDMHSEAKVTAPLQNVRIVDFIEKRVWVEGVGAQCGSSCWHCGTAIVYCVVIEDELGARHDIGTQCAERIGLNKQEIKDLMAQRYAEERREAALRIEQDTEAERVAKYGEHGTITRFESRCYCEECRAMAPHGSTIKYNDGCTCPDCCQSMVDDPTRDLHCYYEIMLRTVVVRLSDGEIVKKAQIVSTQYGSSWRIALNDSGACAWLNPGAKRRSTQAKKGYVEAKAMYLTKVVQSKRDRNWYYFPEVLLASPVVDVYGEKITHIESNGETA